MKKVLVLGCPGSGKSTFARNLKSKTNLPLFHLDNLFHLPDKNNVGDEELCKRITNILKEDSWIIDGNYTVMLEERIKDADTIFLLDIDLGICLKHIEGRIGTKREDIPFIEDEFEEEFREYVINFPKTKLIKIKNLIEKYKNNKTIFVFKTNDETDEYLRRL